MNITKVIVLIFGLLSISIKGLAEEIITITNGEWLPYHSKKLPHFGPGSRIVTEAFALEGVKVEWGFFPWARGYKSVANGTWDASIGWVQTPEREKEVDFSDAVYGGTWVFFHLKSYSFDWETVKDLKGIKIGSTIGYSYGEAFDQARKLSELEVDEVPKDFQNFNKLLRGRIQVFPFALDAGYSTLREKLTSEEVQLITHHPTPVNVKSYHLVFSKKNEKNKHLLMLFNRGLKRLKESGVVDQYLSEAWNKSRI